MFFQNAIDAQQNGNRDLFSHLKTNLHGAALNSVNCCQKIGKGKSHEISSEKRRYRFPIRETSV